MARPRRRGSPQSSEPVDVRGYLIERHADLIGRLGARREDHYLALLRSGEPVDVFAYHLPPPVFWSHGFAPYDRVLVDAAGNVSMADDSGRSRVAL